MQIFLHVGQPWHCLVWIFPVFESIKNCLPREHLRDIDWSHSILPIKRPAVLISCTSLLFPLYSGIKASSSTIQFLPLPNRRENIGSLPKKALSNSVPELSATQILLDMSSFLFQMRVEKNFLGKRIPKWTHTALVTAAWTPPEAARAAHCWRQGVATAFIGEIILYEVFITFRAANGKGI